MSPTSRRWLVGGAIAIAALGVGAIGAAIGRGGAEDTVAQLAPMPTVTVTVAATPAAQPPPPDTPAPTAPAVPAPVAADPVAFRADANSHLDE
jgi:hypothetical protein